MPPRPRRRRGPDGALHLTGPPPISESIDPEFATIPTGEEFFRIYDPEPYAATATSFRHFGPVLRFDHHRADILAPADDPDRAITYIGESFVCCLGEVFGDEAVVEPGTSRISRVTVVKSLKLLDVRGTAATGIGTTQAIGSEGVRSTTHEWARWIYEHRQLKGVDGVIYTAFHSGHDSVALFERAEGKIDTPAGTPDFALSDPGVRSDLLLAAKALRLVVSAS